MAPNKNLPQIYAAALSSHGKGHGFYEPQSVDDVRPGVCGYIDDSGHFEQIVDLTNLRALFDGNYDPVGQLATAPRSEAVWKELYSEGTTRTEANLKIAGSNSKSSSNGGDGDSAAAAASGQPLSGTLTFSLNSSSGSTSNSNSGGVDSGAVLLCNQAVQRQGIANDDPLRRWGQVNARVILRNCRPARERGFWLVTTTWATADTWANAWARPQQDVSIGFKANSSNSNGAHAADLVPKLKYSNSRSGGGWAHPVSKAKGDKSEKKVIFFAGLQFKVFPLPAGASSQDSEKEKRDSSSSSFILTDPDDEAKPEAERAKFRVEVQRVGGLDDADEGAIVEQQNPLAQSTWERSRLPVLFKWAYFMAFFAIMYAMWTAGWKANRRFEED